MNKLKPAWYFFRLLFWGNIWFLIWLFALPWKKAQENCLTWALKKWTTEGGYLVIRWSRSNRISWFAWPHFFWLSEKHQDGLRHVVPRDNPNGPRYTPRPWFDPLEVEGDPEEIIEN